MTLGRVAIEKSFWNWKGARRFVSMGFAHCEMSKAWGDEVEWLFEGNCDWDVEVWDGMFWGWERLGSNDLMEVASLSCSYLQHDCVKVISMIVAVRRALVNRKGCPLVGL